jgi:sphingomyelin phosphodiesterase
MGHFLDFGYYSMPLKAQNGTKLGNTKMISLNSNVCYTMNFDSFIRFQDPGNMLQWLEKELAEVEKDGGNAIILSHVPNLGECTRQYGRRFHAIVERYNHIIRW